MRRSHPLESRSGKRYPHARVMRRPASPVGERRTPMTEPVTSREFTREEVWLAFRNHGMHLEGMRYPITPVGMHYLLIHFDIPPIDPATFTLEIGGLVREPYRLALDEIRSRPAITMPVAMECGGNGRAR